MNEINCSYCGLERGIHDRTLIGASCNFSWACRVLVRVLYNATLGRVLPSRWDVGADAVPEVT